LEINGEIKEELGIGSKMSPVLMEIMMKIWEGERINEEGRIRKF